jgi:hypothetical protein
VIAAALFLVAGCQPSSPASSSGTAVSESTTAAVDSPAPDTESSATAAETEPTSSETPAPQHKASSETPVPSTKILSEQELADGWIALFDGQTLFGWKANSDANWRVEDGTIAVDSGSPGLLCTTAQFTDYVLKCEFRAPAATNSGIFLHTPFKPTDPAKDCYELNIAPPDNPFPTCSLVKRAKAEGNFSGEDWQAYEVTVAGENVKIAINGKMALEYRDPQPLRRGHIGLQLNQGAVAFRNIKLKPLSTTELFNGRDLSGWNEFPDMPSKFTVTAEGVLNVKNGRGQLETKKSYGDFALQLECISHAKHLNSGVFFRCIPGQQMNGYECQIHNGFKDGDRANPMDCGTGGIFRRQNARLVVSNDLEWFHLTLIADGEHMSAWVNGYQVSDWTDDRPPHENPRQGRRTDPGTIMLQGHDPTTDLSFRNLRISEYAERGEPQG